MKEFEHLLKAVLSYLAYHKEIKLRVAWDLHNKKIR